MPITSPAKKHQQAVRAAEIREHLLARAGWDAERRAKLVGKAIGKVEEMLEARKVVVVDGKIVEVTDNQAVLRAAEQVTTLEGVNLSRQASSDGPGKVTVNLNMDWFRPGPTISGGERPVIEITDMQPVENAEDTNG